MNEQQLRQYLQNLNKEQIIELYLQKCYDQQFLKMETLASIYNQIIDKAHHQLNMFDSWDIIISQDKFRAIFNKGGSDEDSDIT